MGKADRPGGGARLAHQPALDGLRGLAVAAVVLFHAGVPGLGGGYVGVSVFFTLSGFLITSLLVREHAATGRVDAGAFYGRRARRLIPASVACLTAVVVLRSLGAWDQVSGLRRDVVAAALQVFNWVRVAGDGSYADLFARSGGQVSPLEHYWSLAIEEQFYWAWPVAFAGLAGWAARRGRSLRMPLGLLAVAGIVAGPVVAQVWGPDAAYWATPARVGEILTGAFVAVLVTDRPTPRWAVRIAPACLTLIAAAVVALPTGRGPAYQGWFPALSTVTAVLLLGLHAPSPLRQGLSWRPLTALGAVSYGVYLYHWPIFTLVDEDRLGRDGPVLLVARLALTLAVAVASHRLLEQPIRRRTWPARPTLVGAGVATLAVVALTATVPAATPMFDTTGGASAEIAVGGDTTPLRPADRSAERPPVDAPTRESEWRRLVLDAPTPPRPVRILVIGDSTAEATGGGLVRWAAANPDLAQVTLAAKPGCGFVRGGVRVFPEREEQISPACVEYVDEVVPERVRELQPDVVVAMTTAWDVINQRFPGTGPQSPVDDEYGRRVTDGFARVTETALDAGAPTVVWIAEPTVDPYWNPVESPQQDPARHAVLHAAARSLASADPERVVVADLAWWLDEAGLAEDRAARPDGVHLDDSAARRVATDWLGPLLIRAALGT